MDKYGSAGFAVLGTPCNQFFNQEPSDNDEILNILRYVRPGNGFVPKFDLTQKLLVNGLGTDGIWSSLKGSCPAPQDILSAVSPSWTPITREDVAWNWESVLVGRDGQPLQRFGTIVDPIDTAPYVQAALAQPAAPAPRS